MSDFSTAIHPQFVNWFRQVSPYIHAHRGRTFVISLDGDTINSPHFPNIIHDIALLNSLGVKIVLVYGIRPQIEACLQQRGLASHYAAGMRITDVMSLPCVKAACGEVCLAIESYLSMGLSNLPESQQRIRTAAGNFITARPLGVRDGVDFCYTGEVRRVDAEAIAQQLEAGRIVLISSIGYSPTGELFNVLAEDVAADVAIAVNAAKWLYLTDIAGLTDPEQHTINSLTLWKAQELLTQQPEAPIRHLLSNAIRACQRGVERVHVLSHHCDGGLLMELFTPDGIGTLISVDPFENIRKATIEDVGGLLELMTPLEDAGILVRRSREKLEMEINHFTLQRRDNTIVACAALYPFVEEHMAELACLAVHPDYTGQQRGDALLAYLEAEARQLGIKHIFVLTTQTAHWFQERGFIAADLATLPNAKQSFYNFQRRSKVFIKHLV